MSNLSNPLSGVGVGVVIERDGKFLLAERLADKHGQGEWSFPGGKPDAGESPEAAAIRELEEETGLVVDDVLPLGYWTYDRWEDREVHCVTLYFVADIGDQEPQDREPHKQGPWEWIDGGDILAGAFPTFCNIERVVGLLV